MDGKTLRGSRDGGTAAQHVLEADHASGTVLASTDVDGHTNEITRFTPLLDQPKRWKTEIVYATTDLPVHHAKPAQLATWTRGHWSIENKVHWVRDVTYDEDRSQIRTGTGANVMAALRNAAISALRLAGFTNIAAANRHHTRDSNRPLNLLRIT